MEKKEAQEAKDILNWMSNTLNDPNTALIDDCSDILSDEVVIRKLTDIEKRLQSFCSMLVNLIKETKAKSLESTAQSLRTGDMMHRDNALRYENLVQRYERILEALMSLLISSASANHFIEKDEKKPISYIVIRKSFILARGSVRSREELPVRILMQDL